MSIQHLIGLWVLMLPAIVQRDAAQAASVEPSAPQRPLVFHVKPDAAAGIPAAQATCTVEFGPPLAIAALAFSPDGTILAVPGYQEILLWDPQSGKLVRRLGRGELAGVSPALVFLDDGKSLAVADGLPYEPGTVKIFDMATGRITRTLPQAAPGPKKLITCLAVSPDGKRLAAGDTGAAVCVWSLPDGKLLKTITAHKGRVQGVAFSPDGKQLVTGSTDQTMQVWDTSTWELAVRYAVSASVQNVIFSPDGKSVLAAVGGPEGNALRVGRLESDLQDSGRRAPRAASVSTGGAMPLDLVWPVQGPGLLVALNDGTAQAWQSAGRKQLATYAGHDDWVYAVASSPRGSPVATAGGDGTVKLFDAAKGRLLATLIQLAPRTDRWLTVTPLGYFAGSDPVRLQWASEGADAGPQPLPQEVSDKLNNPQRVAEILAGTYPPPVTKVKQKTKSAPASPKKIDKTKIDKKTKR